MIVAPREHADLETPSGTMRTYVYRPAEGGRRPGLVLFSEIFQVTEPIERLAIQFAGHGYVVSVPEIFHELEEGPGVVLGYDDAGKDRGNAHKTAKEVASYDADARAALDHLAGHPACTGAVGVVGLCIGGHLAFRAAFNEDVRAAVCLYATDLHGGTLGAGGNDSLARTGEIAGELLMIWGKQDPHIPAEGRAIVHSRLTEAEAQFTWHEFNGQHAFMRDGGERHDPALARLCVGLALELFHRRLCAA